MTIVARDAVLPPKHCKAVNKTRMDGEPIVQENIYELDKKINNDGIPQSTKNSRPPTAVNRAASAQRVF